MPRLPAVVVVVVAAAAAAAVMVAVVVVRLRCPQTRTQRLKQLHRVPKLTP